MRKENPNVLRKMLDVGFTGVDFVSRPVLVGLTFVEKGEWEDNANGLPLTSTADRFPFEALHQTEWWSP